MVNIILVQLLILLISISWGKTERTYFETYLGEKRIDTFSGMRNPTVTFDIYQGRITFEEDNFWQSYFQPYLFDQEKEFNHFLKTELSSGMSCPNVLFAEHFADLRFSYRLIALSYLLEGQWHNEMISSHLGWKKGCRFNFDNWLDRCHPKSREMSKFISLLKKFQPKYQESLSSSYGKKEWLSDFRKKDFSYYSHYRMSAHCGDNCPDNDLETKSHEICLQDENLMTSICSETDEIYGISGSVDAYQLLGQSNIINTYNQQGEALGCLRRFSSVMAHKEVKYKVFTSLFKPLRDHLQKQYKERFLQGRVFFYGSGKEFEAKGLSNLHVMEQPLKIEKLNLVEAPIVQSPPVISETKPNIQVPKEPVEKIKKVNKLEVKAAPLKSSFLLAAESRKKEDLAFVEVDMLKFKYDYVFTLNMINSLAPKMKNFVTRDALKEMMAYDKLGTKDGPVPLLFIKYMIDMQEHTGLYNLISTLGDEFFVSNEIDTTYERNLEKIRLVNNESTDKQWQIFILRP